MNSHRSNYRQTLGVLKGIASGLHPKEIKSELSLSRYSYNYTINRLIANDFIEYEKGKLVVSRKGVNILKFEKEYPEEMADKQKLKIISSLFNLSC